MHTKKQRIMAFLTLLTFVVITLFSVLFIVKEANHDCSGENCSICVSVQRAEQNIRQFGSSKINIFSFGVIALFFVLPIFCPVLFVISNSLTSQKVRLND